MKNRILKHIIFKLLIVYISMKKGLNKSNSCSCFVNMNKIMSKSKRSQAGVVTAVLLILIVIIAMIIVANIIYGIVKKNTSDSDSTDILTISMEIKQTKLFVTGGAQINVYRGVGEGTVSGLKFIFENKNGERKIIARNENLSEMTQKNFVFNSSEIGYNNSEINKIFVVPIMGSSVGSEVGEKPEIVKKDASGNRVLDANLNTGLVSWWKFDGDALDSSDNGNTGVYNLAAQSVNGVLVNTPSPGSFTANILSNTILTSGTLTIWFKKDSLNSNGTIFAINSVNSTGAYCGSGIGIDFTTNKLSFLIKDLATYQLPGSIIASDVINDQNWHFVALKFDTISAILYFDSGTPKLTTAYTAPRTIIGYTSSVAIGVGTGCHWGYYYGYIDNAMIFNRSLSDAEIDALYNNQKK